MKLSREEDLDPIGKTIRKLEESQKENYSTETLDVIYFLRKSYSIVEAKIIFDETKGRIYT